MYDQDLKKKERQGNKIVDCLKKKEKKKKETVKRMF